MKLWQFIQADARCIPLADKSVQCVVTSPPYFALRDYGVDGQIGLEDSFDQYLANLVAVFREVWRVLRDDGTCWVNMGDGYASAWACNRRNLEGNGSPDLSCRVNKIANGLKEKDLIGMPWRLAMALQADGWYLRSDIIWHKPNPMPESVTDRPTKAHEYIFLLAKSERYFYDAEATKEKGKCPEVSRESYAKMLAKTSEAWYPRVNGSPRQDAKQDNNFLGGKCPPGGRNMRTVWTMSTCAYPGAHFATFPVELPTRCIKAGTSEKGCCPQCGTAWRRVLDKVSFGDWNTRRKLTGDHVQNGGQSARRFEDGRYRPPITTAWIPACKCDAVKPVPCLVLDPFSGAGTTVLAATMLGRRGIGIDLKPDYIAQSVRRLGARKMKHRQGVLFA